jgi:limonene-1,2-epoxide hydrolase
MSENQRIVRQFIEACNANDLDRILGFFTPDCVYHNIPVPAVKGTDAIRNVLQGFMSSASEVDWVVHHIAESGDGTVLTERTDRFLMGDKWVELPVMGSFELRAGKIAAWRDYFDLQQFQKQLPVATES